MEERTRAYLRGRFRDHYRRASVTPPPDADAREWGYVPWTEGPDETMVRHRSTLDLGDLSAFLAEERPRHVYFSAGRYDHPGASRMDEKGWRDSDLVFDLDADHLPAVDLGGDSYGEMLAKCKDQLLALLAFLEDDFGFRDLTVVFSGGRGYHVHVRDDAVRGLGSRERREIVDYVRGTGLEFDALLDRELVGGSAGRSTPAAKRTLPTDAGWGRRVHGELTAFVDEVLALDDDAAVDRLREFEGIGEAKAEAVLGAARNNRAEIEAGNVDVHPSFLGLARALADRAADRRHAHIDEPVTTDVNRLIRLPGSLHGGSGLAVTRIDRDAVEAFDPTVDAIPETFRGHEVTVEVPEATDLTLGGETFTVEAGDVSLPEYQAVYLMARGRAEKSKE